ncbi:MAG: GIY-YIG nuclease family protein [Chloroflexota bacterium]
MVDIPQTIGVYALLLTLSQRVHVITGRLGRATFAAGKYIYVGSAFGSGGLRSRLERHLRGDGRPHWHVDALRSKADIVGFYFLATNDRVVGDVPWECLWSQALMALPEVSVPLSGFGSSDCRSGCSAHLVCIPARYRWAVIYEVLSYVVDWGTMKN